MIKEISKLLKEHARQSSGVIRRPVGGCYVLARADRANGLGPGAPVEERCCEMDSWWGPVAAMPIVRVFRAAITAAVPITNLPPAPVVAPPLQPPRAGPPG
jgi:hypothetical protein